MQKILAQAGIASRRASEAIIRAGRVTLNGVPVIELGTKADPAVDEIRVDGQVLRARRRLCLALHKPAKYLCSCRDPHATELVTDLLPREWRNLYPVGRLDRESEGLLFLTNDGDFCLRLTHPRYGVRKRYVATVAGKLTPAVLANCLRGIRDRGELLRAESARLRSAHASHSVVELDLVGGKNREVRRLFESQGFTVERLVRTQIGPIKLGELPPGRWRVLSEVEIDSLLTTRPHAD